MEPWIVSAAEELCQKWDKLDAAVAVVVGKHGVGAGQQEALALIGGIIKQHYEEMLQGQPTCRCQK